MDEQEYEDFLAYIDSMDGALDVAFAALERGEIPFETEIEPGGGHD